jgi:hypothetical protein
VALKTCKVSCFDLKQVEHTVEVSAAAFMSAHGVPTPLSRELDDRRRYSLHMVNAFWHGSSLLLPSPQHRLRERVNSKEHGERLQFIGPGKPIQNAHIESHDGHLREEC